MSAPLWTIMGLSPLLMLLAVASKADHNWIQAKQLQSSGWDGEGQVGVGQSEP